MLVPVNTIVHNYVSILVLSLYMINDFSHFWAVFQQLGVISWQI